MNQHIHFSHRHAHWFLFGKLGAAYDDLEEDLKKTGELVSRLCVCVCEREHFRGREMRSSITFFQWQSAHIQHTVHTDAVGPLYTFNITASKRNKPPSFSDNKQFTLTSPVSTHPFILTNAILCQGAYIWGKKNRENCLFLYSNTVAVFTFFSS